MDTDKNKNTKKKRNDGKAKNVYENDDFKDLFSSQKSLFDNDAVKELFKSNQSIFERNDFKDLFSSQKSLFDNDAVKELFKSNQSIFERNDFKDLFSSQKSLFDNDSFRNVFSIQNNLWGKDYSKLIQNTCDSISKNFHQSDLSKLSGIIKDNNLSTTDISNISINGNTLSIKDQNYQINELREMVSNILNESGINNLGSTLANSFDKIYFLLSEIKNSNLRSIIYNTIISIILTALSIIYSPKLIDLRDKYLTSHRKEAIKKIEKMVEIAPVDFKPFISQCRFVCIEVLNVRKESKQRSLLIGKLYFSQIVKVIRKNKNWTLVELVNVDSEASIKGWVFTRYIRKFR